MYLRRHLSRARSPSRSPSSDRTSFTRRVPPLRLLPRALHVPHQSLVPLVPTRDTHSRSHDPAISLPAVRIPARAIPLSPAARPPLIAHRFFFPRGSFFFLNTPPSRSVIFIICYLLRHTPPAVVAAVAATAAVCPARPTRKNRKIEENKSGRRGAPRIPQGGALGRRGGGNGDGAARRGGDQGDAGGRGKGRGRWPLRVARGGNDGASGGGGR